MHSGIDIFTLVCHIKYAYTLHGQFGDSKPVIVIESCVINSGFTFANLQNVSLKLLRPQILYLIFYFVFK